MKHRRVPLGRQAIFLLPSVKLRTEWEPGGKTVEQVIAQFLMANFGAYTVTAGSISGEWRDPESGKTYYDEHRQYAVSFVGKERIPDLELFLATIAYVIGEECIHLTTGEDAWLIFPEKK